MTISEESTTKPPSPYQILQQSQITESTPLNIEDTTPLTTTSSNTPNPTITLDINKTALIDVITGKRLSDPCFSDCGCYLTLSRKTWMNLTKTDGIRICPNPSCKKTFKVLTSNWLVASLLKTPGCITQSEHFEQHKQIEKEKKLIQTFDTLINEGNIDEASDKMQDLKQILPTDSSELQSRIKKLFQLKEQQLRKRKLPQLPEILTSSNKRQRQSSPKKLSNHRARILKIRQKREEVLSLVVKKEVLESMKIDDDGDNLGTSDQDKPMDLHPNIPTIVTLSQIFTAIGTRETYVKAEVLTFISELIENKDELNSKEKRDIIDPLWRDTFDPVNGLELTKTQLNSLLVAINNGYKEYISKLKKERERQKLDSLADFSEDLTGFSEDLLDAGTPLASDNAISTKLSPGEFLGRVASYIIEFNLEELESLLNRCSDSFKELWLPTLTINGQNPIDYLLERNNTFFLSQPTNFTIKLLVEKLLSYGCLSEFNLDPLSQFEKDRSFGDDMDWLFQL